MSLTTVSSPSVAPPAVPSSAPLRLAVIIGSVREGRFGAAVAHWFAGAARHRPDLEVEVIDPAGLPLEVTGPTERPGDGTARSLEALRPRLAAADAFVVVTPEYNHSYPAALKNLIDWHREEWQAKPAGFVSYGGMSGGLRAVEHLRQVFAELHTVTVRDTVSFHNAWDRFGEDGLRGDDESAGAAAKTLLDQLVWWGRALREARAGHPYGG
ncbi:MULTISPECIES: NADPH-dependent FMN reductase [Streptomyces]|uniref:NADPH-dependent oxidoreductase n=2 Tax=Streptomyces TaxID=1883 RepID=A0A3M8EUU0_9ACTN|nr:MULTISPECIES: NAD(P)H-dependent oxidoreductase [Streptomyces]KNE80286.1 NADPH-dependent FMN reductase [Streptomyces fradiae]OFA39784.1 NADPH-dependent FMN reductase [Streptomyces fradiae]PQM20471.1 NADPH-dependent oxidoreductase [Streptomyces xinghaiensis]RKM91281.1 NADPH-dependent oxidoreductase [Streptomyces xinghaiensis]RNC69775.1 NADPH-dependent oxidoreductase [Streptomyces xinghaiensis]